MDNAQLLLNLCKNISFLRKKNNLSKAKMAKILGIGIKTLNSIENGILPPRLNCDVLYRIHHHFNISIDEMFYDELNM